MSDASVKVVKKKELVEVVREEKEITLTLSVEEAEFLHTLVGMTHEPYRLSSSIHNSLSRVLLDGTDKSWLSPKYRVSTYGEPVTQLTLVRQYP